MLKNYFIKPILMMFLVCTFSNQAFGMFQSQTTLFNDIYSAGFTEIVEIPYSHWLNQNDTHAKIIDTSTPGRTYSLENIDPERRSEFDFKEGHNLMGSPLHYYSYQLDNFMVCFVKSTETNISEISTENGFSFCYVFPHPISLVVQKLESHRERNGGVR